MRTEGTFIGGGAGRILVVSHEPEAPSDRTVLVVPAFAEEMNKSRRLIFDTAEALAERGCATIVPDLYGTGDSEGDFTDARWGIWIDDLRLTLEWARSRGADRFSAVCVRLGAALLDAAAPHLGTQFERTAVWHPVEKGADALKQLLRMKVMAARMAGQRAEPVEILLQALLIGPEPIDLGGYLVAPELGRAVNDATFAPTSGSGDGLVIEVGAAAAGAQQAPDGWRRTSIGGERFWVVVEPRPNPALVSTTVEFLLGRA